MRHRPLRAADPTATVDVWPVRAMPEATGNGRFPPATPLDQLDVHTLRNKPTNSTQLEDIVHGTVTLIRLILGGKNATWWQHASHGLVQQASSEQLSHTLRFQLIAWVGMCSKSRLHRKLVTERAPRTGIYVAISDSLLLVQVYGSRVRV